MVVIKGEGSGGKNLGFINVDDEQELRYVKYYWPIIWQMLALVPNRLYYSSMFLARTKLVFLIIAESWL